MLVLLRLRRIDHSVTYAIDSGSCLSVKSIAAIRLPGCDIGEAFVSAGVDPRVQEAEYGFASAKACVIEECNNRGGDLSGVSKSFAIIQLKCRLAGEAAEVPPLGVRAPP